MVSQEQVAEIAKQSIQNYLNQCKLGVDSDAADVLMNLIAAAGVVMVATVGHQEGIERMCVSIAAVEKKTAGVTFTKKTVN